MIVCDISEDGMLDDKSHPNPEKESRSTPTFTSQSRAPSFQKQLDISHTLPSIRSISSVSFLEHVQISTAACVARSPAQCVCLEAILDHCATTQDLQELEELDCTMDAGWWFDLLLQHFERFR